MAMSYEAAVEALYRAPQDAFVAERKRLAAELKSGGDRAGATRLAKLPRPPLSVWVVNQLWWRARPAFEALLAAASRLRGGDLTAGPAHREALAGLRARAGDVLLEAGHAAAEPTLRRVTTTLAALAATGGFAPDCPGALSADRDPPGFEAMELTLTALAVPPTPAGAPSDAAVQGRGLRLVSGGRAAERAVDEARAGAARERPGAREAAPRAAPKQPRGEVAREDTGTKGRQRAHEERRAREEELRRAEQQRAREEELRREQQRAREEELRRVEQQRAREEELRRAEEEAERERAKRRIEASLRNARSTLEARERDVERLRAELASRQAKADEARSAIAELEARLAALER